MARESGSLVQTLRAKSPEASPYLAAFEVTLAEIAQPTWSAAVGELAPRAGSPLLAGARIPVKPRAFSRFLERVLGAGLAGAARDMAVRAVRESAFPALPLLAAVIDQDAERTGRLAAVFGGAESAATALLQVAALPLLQALRGQHTSELPSSWSHGPCAFCGAFPALCELRGLERRRRLFCGRCGHHGDTAAIGCPFCGETDHHRLVSLLPEEGSESRKVEACDVCSGYIKTLATVIAWPAESVRLHDLGTIDLDIAALDRGRRRPADPTLVPGVSLVADAEPWRWGIFS